MHSFSSSSCHEPGQFKHFDSISDSFDHFNQNETIQVYLSRSMFFLFRFVIFYLGAWMKILNIFVQPINKGEMDEENSSRMEQS